MSWVFFGAVGSCFVTPGLSCFFFGAVGSCFATLGLGFSELLAPACWAGGSGLLPLDVLGSKSLACLGLFILLADYIYRFCRCVFFILVVAGLMANQDWAEVLKQAAVPETASAVAAVYANADVFRYAFKTENVLDQFTKKKVVELKFVASPEAECHPATASSACVFIGVWSPALRWAWAIAEAVFGWLPWSCTQWPGSSKCGIFARDQATVCAKSMGVDSLEKNC